MIIQCATPAHDPNDFEIGRRHDLEEVNIIKTDGTLNENAGKYKGMERYAGRKQLVEDLKKKGYSPVGIRLDSGDLAYLSIQAARMLDAAGFPDTKIVLSNQMDELVIWQIITQIKEESKRYDVDPNALIKRLAYGVGTRMITSSIDPALDGVYKLVAIQEKDEWIPAMKISENPEKTLNPGHKHVWRLYDKRNKAIADVMSLPEEDLCAHEQIELHHPTEPSKYRTLSTKELSKIEPLPVSIISNGKIDYEKMKELGKKRGRLRSELDLLDSELKLIEQGVLKGDPKRVKNRIEEIDKELKEAVKGYANIDLAKTKKRQKDIAEEEKTQEAEKAGQNAKKSKSRGRRRY